VGAPLLVPSANISGEQPAVNDEQVMESLGDEICVIVKGKCISQKPSTIVKVENGR
jgi:tRNA A37 threonylcarbamoyladenosine synthetase subunit TsaC/SUA5/YrdC